MDPDPAIFVIDLQDANKKLFFPLSFSAYFFLKLHSHLFSKIKSQKEVTNNRSQGFAYYICLMIEESGAGSGPLNNGSGSRRPINIRFPRSESETLEKGFTSEVVFEVFWIRMGSGIMKANDLQKLK